MEIVKLTVKLSEKEWAVVYNKMANQFKNKPSVIMINEVRKRELGFTVRRHRWWDSDNDEYQEQIHLDFNSPEMLTFFRLQYL